MSRHKQSKYEPRALGDAPHDSLREAVIHAGYLNVNGRFFTVCKDSHLLYSAYEITVVDGRVVETKLLTRAPDLTAVAVGQVAAGVWGALRQQMTSEVFSK